MLKTSVYLFIGAYGSGKTEAAINFARRERSRGGDVSLVDLDIVNPYFRSRDARALLQTLGLRVISSAVGFEQADLPALSPAIAGALQTPGLKLVFDVGGDPVGAKALGRFHRLLTPLAPEVWAVVNPYRPETHTPEEIAGMARSLAASGRQEVTGLVANPNLGPETTVAHVAAGLEPVKKAAELLNLPVVFTCVREDLAGEAAGVIPGEILALHRYMLLPWE